MEHNSTVQLVSYLIGFVPEEPHSSEQHPQVHAPDAKPCGEKVIRALAAKFLETYRIYLLPGRQGWCQLTWSSLAGGQESGWKWVNCTPEDISCFVKLFVRGPDQEVLQVLERVHEMASCQAVIAEAVRWVLVRLRTVDRFACGHTGLASRQVVLAFRSECPAVAGFQSERAIAMILAKAIQRVFVQGSAAPRVVATTNFPLRLDNGKRKRVRGWFGLEFSGSCYSLAQGD